MATGNQQPEKSRPPEKPVDEPQQERAPGEVVAGSGRISAARRVTPVLPTLPFTRSQLADVDAALATATRRTGLYISIYLGGLGDDTRARAEELLDSTGKQAGNAVLVAVSPGQRVVEVVTGPQARGRLTDRGCKVAVMSMVASFEQGDLGGGLVNGLRTIVDQATVS
ncbi:MAG: DUF5130 family protein [Pseudonocardiaceae bacterium]